MAKFFMYGKYSQEAIGGISADRTKKALEVIAKAGGKVNSITSFPAITMEEFDKITA